MSDNPEQTVEEPEQEQTGFKIGDKVYDWPDGGPTGIEEACLFEEVSGMTIWEYAEHLERFQLTRRTPPLRWMRGLAYIATVRAKEAVTPEQFKTVEFAIQWDETADEGDAGPPELSEPPRSDGGGSSSETSGTDASGSPESSTEESELGVPV